MRVFDGDDIDNLMLLGAAEAWNSQLIGGGSVTFVAKQGRSYPILIQGSPEQYLAFVKNETSKWAPIVKRAGVKAE